MYWDKEKPQPLLEKYPDVDVTALMRAITYACADDFPTFGGHKHLMRELGLSNEQIKEFHAKDPSVNAYGRVANFGKTCFVDPLSLMEMVYKLRPE